MPSDSFLETKNDKIDLSIGNPAIMFDYWKLVRQLTEGGGRTDIAINEYMSYDYSQVNEELKETIKKLHKSMGNAEVNGYEVVFGHGASQLISAASYAVRKMHKLDFYLPTPFWSRIPFLLDIGSYAQDLPDSSPVCWTVNVNEEVISFVTCPNNPDGLETRPAKKSVFNIYDCCYNWPQYTQVKKYAGDVVIFGLSKATGHAGSRLGWALVKHPQVAVDMRKYIEMTTSGVSQDSQIRALTILKTLEQLKEDELTSVFDTTKAEMDKRWGLFSAKTKDKKDFKVLNRSGMFAWCQWNEKGDGAVLFGDKYKVAVSGGEPFGASKQEFRINLACYKDDFEQFMKALSQND